MIFIASLAVLNMASIRKAEDPIRDTQTEGVLYKQKMEEEKDGKKGPLLYNVKYNPSDNFLTAPPNAVPKDEKAAAETTKASQAGGTDWWEEVPSADKTLDKTQEPKTDNTDWWEEVPPADEGKVSVQGDSSAVPQLVPGEELTEAQQEPRPAVDGAVPASKSSSDDWW